MTGWAGVSTLLLSTNTASADLEMETGEDDPSLKTKKNIFLSRSPVFDLNFNRAELKIAEALQLLSSSDHDHLFSSPLLALDVGAAPGGWTGHLASLDLCPVSVIAVDPGSLDPQLLGLKNIKHLACKAELVSGGGGAVLRQEAETLVGGGWRGMVGILAAIRPLLMPFPNDLTHLVLLCVDDEEDEQHQVLLVAAQVVSVLSS